MTNTNATTSANAHGKPWESLVGTATKKPVPAQFIRFDGMSEMADIIIDWAWYYSVKIEKTELLHDGEYSGVFILLIPTLEGQMKVTPGAYVIKGNENEFWPVKASIFEKTYEVKPKVYRRGNGIPASDLDPEPKPEPNDEPGLLRKYETPPFNPPLVPAYPGFPSPGPYPGYPGNGWHVTSETGTVEQKFTGTDHGVGHNPSTPHVPVEKINEQIQQADKEFTIRSARSYADRTEGENLE